MLYRSKLKAEDRGVYIEVKIWLPAEQYQETLRATPAMRQEVSIEALDKARKIDKQVFLAYLRLLLHYVSFKDNA